MGAKRVGAREHEDCAARKHSGLGEGKPLSTKAEL